MATLCIRKIWYRLVGLVSVRVTLGSTCKVLDLRAVKRVLGMYKWTASCLST